MQQYNKNVENGVKNIQSVNQLLVLLMPSALIIIWCFTPLLTVFQSYHGDSSHYSCETFYRKEKSKSTKQISLTLSQTSPCLYVSIELF